MLPCVVFFVQPTAKPLTGDWKSICLAPERPASSPSLWVRSLNSGLGTGQADPSSGALRDSHWHTALYRMKLYPNLCVHPTCLSATATTFYLTQLFQEREPQYSASKETWVPGLWGTGQPRTTEEEWWSVQKLKGSTHRSEVECRR